MCCTCNVAFLLIRLIVTIVFHRSSLLCRLALITLFFYFVWTNYYREIRFLPWLNLYILRTVLLVRVWGCFGGGTTIASWRQKEWDGEKRACRRAIYFFNFAPLRGVKILSNRNKVKCRRCRRKFLRKIAKYSHGKKGKKPWKKPRIGLIIVAEYTHLLKTESLDNAILTIWSA